MDTLFAVWAGYVVLRSGLGRCKDAFGHTRYAGLALLPFTCLWLAFPPSQDPERWRDGPKATFDEDTPRWTIFILFSVFPVIATLALVFDEEDRKPFGWGFVVTAVDRDIRGKGLDAVLHETAMRYQIGAPWRPFSLSAVDVLGNTLRLDHTVADPRGTRLSPDFRKQTQDHLCDQNTYWAITQSGATVEYRYLDPGGHLLDTITITKAICDPDAGP